MTVAAKVCQVVQDVSSDSSYIIFVTGEPGG